MSTSHTPSVRAVKELSKLLNAAEKAHNEGKFLALAKILGEAKKLSGRLDEVVNEENKSPKQEKFNSSFFKSAMQFNRMQPPKFKYKKVTGEIV